MHRRRTGESVVVTGSPALVPVESRRQQPSWSGRGVSWIRLGLAAGTLLFSLSAPAAPPLEVQSQRKVAADHAENMKRGRELFASRVRSVLSRHCLDCHGGKQTKADFSLATRQQLLDSGHVDLEEPEDSWILKLVRHTEEPHMPLKAPQLMPAEIEVLAEWIRLGAAYDRPLGDSQTTRQADSGVTQADREFWSFQPLRIVRPPDTAGDWVRTPIDQFVRHRLQQSGLEPNSPADRRTLIRRAYLDLLGLPPTAEQVQAFVADPDPDAYDTLIDELLKSPHYGERWARHWIDVARFGESGGFEHDDDRPHAYHYRDFLIRAFNRDLPYDRFVAYQLAGDELAPDDPLAMRATGFMGAGVFPSQLTEVEFESARYDELDDIVTTTGVAFLGLSIGCARCHDHKFDPIPSEDYYRLASSFTKTIRSQVEVPVDAAILKARKAAHQRRVEAAARKLADYENSRLKPAFKELLEQGSDIPVLAPGAWRMLRPLRVTSTAGTEFAVQDDSSILATGKAAKQEVITFEAEAVLSDVRSLRLEALTHDSLPRRGPGRADNGNFALGDIQVEVIDQAGSGTKRQVVKLTRAVATHQQNSDSLSVAASIDDDGVSGWAVDGGGIGTDQAAVFSAAAPFGSSDQPAVLVVRMTFNHPNGRHALGRFRLAVSAAAQPQPQTDPAAISQEVLEAVNRLRDQANEDSDDWQLAWNWFCSTQPEWKTLQAALEAERNRAPAATEPVLVSSEGLPKLKHHADGRGYPHFYPQTHVLLRGDVKQKVKVAEQGFLRVLMPLDATARQWQVPPPKDWTRTSYQRAALARWMMDTKDGAGQLAARVIVNRLWQHHFGTGIVSTPNDFGVQGERPSHPELLDWLAARLILNGWQLKPIHKLIMTSRVYMQSSDFVAERAEVDPDNRLLWRWEPRRLEGEAIRDAILASSGLLDPTMYGPGTLDESMRRRSIYFRIKRSQLIPSMMAFDWPEHLVSIGRRASTTVAPQALVFLNGPLVRACAVQLANRLAGGDSGEVIQRAYLELLGRKATPAELESVQRFWETQTAAYESQGESAPATVALADLCQTLFCMNEFIYID